MPASRSQSAVLRTTLLAVALAAAACNDDDSPVGPAAPDAAEPIGVEATGATPDFLTAGSGPRILFTSARTGGGDIYRIASNGTGLVRMTSFSGRDVTAVWSRDNQRIAFVRSRLDASNVPHQDIYLMNADGTGKHWARSLPSSFDITRPSWSKDGTRLVATVYIGGQGRLAIMDVATGNMTYVNLAMGGPIGYGPDWDPTSQRIVYSGVLGDTLHMINADGTGHKVIIPKKHVGDAHFSPDGKRIAVSYVPPGESWDIGVKNLVDGTFKRLTTSGYLDFAPTWSADGSKLAFVSSRSGKNQIFVMPSAGGTQVRITDNTADENFPSWSH
jgi:Tol biopolymer transport system component